MPPSAGFLRRGEQSGAFVLTVERARPGRRFGNASLLTAVLIGGMGFAVMISLIVNLTVNTVQLEGWAWRIPFLLAAPIGLSGLYIRRRLADSVEFERARRAQQELDVRKTPFTLAFRLAKKPMFVLFCWMAMQAATNTLIIGFFTTYLVEFHKYSLSSALTVLLVACGTAIVVIPMVGRVGDRMSLRSFAVSVCVAQAVCALPTLLLLANGLVSAIIAAAIYSIVAFSCLIVSGVLVVVLFPAAIRYTASAIPYQVAYVVFGGGTPIVATALVAGCPPSVLGLGLIGLCLAAAAVVAWGVPSGRDPAATGLDSVPAVSSTERTVD